MQNCLIQQQSIPAELVAPLSEYSAGLADAAELHRCLNKDGYVFLRGVLDEADVMEVRREVFDRLHEMGEIQSPSIDGIATGTIAKRWTSSASNSYASELHATT